MSHHVLMILVFVTLTAAAQDEAKPSVEQCRADGRAWYESVSMAGSQKAEVEVIDRLSIDELDRRTGAMVQCVAVDSTKSQDYMQMVGMYVNVLHLRERNFIERHGLLATLRAEDAAGKR